VTAGPGVSAELAAALADLDRRAPEHMPQPDLERISELVKLLDHPELAYPSVQITGTNGKTTTAGLVTALACAHGLTTGTFTSPHVVSVTDRLTVCGEPIEDDEFAGDYERLRPYLELVDARVGSVTYFEALTGLAFLWFADRPVGLGVFEVGMGGTWDATNVARGEVAVLCPIGLDHVGVLGSTIPEIAREKAGIIKEGGTAVVRLQSEEARQIIERRCRDVRARVLWEGPDFGIKRETRRTAVGGQVFSVSGAHGEYDDLFLPLFGESAGANAATAIVAVEALLERKLDESAVRGAMASVRLPGRMELVGRGPLVILDGAHNPEAMQEVLRSLGHSFQWRRAHLVMAMSEDKDIEAVARVAARLGETGQSAASGYVARNSTARAASAERVAAALRQGALTDIATFDTVADAVSAARSAAGEDDLILVTGSFYTVADARPLFVVA
jgi:dihydrofolate synthase / folylpolyglutamate synthase